MLLNKVKKWKLMANKYEKVLFLLQLSRVRSYGFFVFSISFIERIYYTTVRLSVIYLATPYQLKKLKR